MTDISKLGVEVTGSGIKETKRDLLDLAGAGGQAEKATNKVAASSRGLSGDLKAVIGAINANTAALKASIGATNTLTASQGQLSASTIGATNAMNAAAAAYSNVGNNAQRAAAIGANIAGQKQKVQNASNNVTKSLKLQAHEWTNLGYQVQDIGVMLASGQNPLLLMAQQGSQVYQIMAGSRGGVKGAFNEMLGVAGRVATRFLPVGLAIGAVAGAFGLFTRNVKKGNEDLTKGMGLSAEQLERVKNKSVTMGDSVGAFFEVLGSRLYKAFEGPISAVRGWLTKALDWTTEFVGKAVGYLVGGFVGAFRAIGATWKMIPAVIGDATISAVNIALGAINGLINGGIKGLNFLITKTNEVLKTNIGQVGEVAGVQIQNSFAGAMNKAGQVSAQEFAAGLAEGQGWVSDFASDWAKETLENARERIKKDAGKAPKGSKAGKSDAEKEYENAVKAAKDYIDSLKAEQRQIGLNEFQRKELEGDLQVEKLLKAGVTAETLKLAAAIEKETLATVAKLKAQGLIDENKRLTQEAGLLTLQASLLNASNRERAVAIAQYEKLAELTARGYTAEEAGATAAKAGENAGASYDVSLGIGSIKDQATEYLAVLKEMQDATSAAAAGMADAFGSVGKAIGDITGIIVSREVEQQESKLRLIEAAEKYGKESTRYKDIELRETQRNKQAEIKSYGDMAGAAKGFFKEKSLGYKVMQAAEMGFRMFEFAMSAKSIAVKAVETGAKIGLYGAETAAGVTAGAAHIFAALGPFGFPVVAAMLALMAGLGFSGGSGGAGSQAVARSATRQETQGTGTVLGDPTGKSKSLEKSLEIAASNSNKDLEYSNAMVNALRSIDNKIGTLTDALARQIGVAGSMFDTKGLNLGTSGKNGFLGIGGKSTVRELSDLGIQFDSASVADILNNGVSGRTYQEVMKTTTKKGFLGIGGGTKTSYETSYGNLQGDIASSIQGVIGALQDGIVQAAKVLGLTGAEEALKSFVVNIGNVSFANMTGAEIQETLNAIFSKVGDDMASTVIPGIDKLQRTGEGAMETLVRLAREYQVVDMALASIGKAFGSVGASSVAARSRLVELFGSMDDFVELTNSFAENFLTEQERLAPIQASVTAEMKRLGLEGITTKEAFKTLVLGLDTSTEKGASLYASLMKIAPAFALVADAADEVLNTRVNNAKNALKTAQDDLINVYTREATALKNLRDKWKGFADSIRKTIEDLKFGPTAQLSPLEQYNAAKSLFQSTVTRAQGGDETAITELPNVAKAFVEASRDFYATSANFFNDQSTVLAALEAIAVKADTKAGEAQQVLTALNNLMDGIDGVIDGIVDLGNNVKLSIDGGVFTLNTTSQTIAERLDNGTLTVDGAIAELNGTVGTSGNSIVSAIGTLQGALGEYASALAAQTLAATTAAQNAMTAAQQALEAANRPDPTPPPPTPATETPTATAGYQAAGSFAGYVQGNPDLAALYAQPQGDRGMFNGLTMEQAGQRHWERAGQYENRPVRPFAKGGVIDKPTYMPLAGEAGPEAVLPLERDSSGKLGVRATNDNGGSDMAAMFEAFMRQQAAISERNDKRFAELAEQIATTNRRLAAK